MRGSLLKEDDKQSAARALADPELFGRTFLGGDYTPDQSRVLQAVREYDRVAVHSGHGVGKTRLAADLVLWYLHRFWPSKVLTTGPGKRQVDRQIWTEIRDRFKNARVPLGSELAPRGSWLRISDDHFAFGLSVSDAGKLQGFHSPNLLVVVDEAGEVEPEIQDAINYLVTGLDAKVLKIGNPSEPSGSFYESCCGIGDYETVHLDCLNHPNVVEDRNLFPGAVTREWVEDRRDEWGEDSALWTSRVRGLFPDQGLDTLIALSWVQRAAQVETEARDRVPILGVDVARFGDDETAVCVLEGRRVALMTGWYHRDLMETCGRIGQLKRERGYGKEIPVVVDDVGLGGGVTDRLRELGHAVIPFNAGAAPRDEVHFRDLAAEAWWKLRETLRKEQINIPEGEKKLRAQLCSRKYKPNSAGAIELERKDEMKDRGLESPDRAEALVMAWWAQYRGRRVKPRRRRRGRRSELSQFDEIVGYQGDRWGE